MDVIKTREKKLKDADGKELTDHDVFAEHVLYFAKLKMRLDMEVY